MSFELSRLLLFRGVVGAGFGLMSLFPTQTAVTQQMSTTVVRLVRTPAGGIFLFCLTVAVIAEICFTV